MSSEWLLLLGVAPEWSDRFSNFSIPDAHLLVILVVVGWVGWVFWRSDRS